MDDLTAFESLIRNAASQAVGPPRPVDAVAVVRSAKAASGDHSSPVNRWLARRTSTRPEGGFNMFSALKFVVAGVIVALFGGFLVAGVLTTPQADEILPGAMPTSPQPTSESAPDGSVPPGGTVEVSIDGLEGASGSRLAAILYQGVPPLAGGDTPLHGLGAFTADITSDPFSVTDTILSVTPFREGYRWLEATADAPVAEVPPGIHTLVVWVSHDLGPYSEWVPSEPIDRVCARFLTVTSGDRTTIELPLQPADSQTLEGAPDIPICLPY